MRERIKELVRERDIEIQRERDIEIQRGRKLSVRPKISHSNLNHPDTLHTVL